MPETFATSRAYAEGFQDGRRSGILAERERVRAAIEALPGTRLYASADEFIVRADVLAALAAEREVSRRVEGDPED